MKIHNTSPLSANLLYQDHPLATLQDAVEKCNDSTEVKVPIKARKVPRTERERSATKQASARGGCAPGSMDLHMTDVPPVHQIRRSYKVSVDHPWRSHIAPVSAKGQEVVWLVHMAKLTILLATGGRWRRLVRKVSVISADVTSLRGVAEAALMHGEGKGAM